MNLDVGTTLPQKEPFRFIDEILALNELEREILCKKKYNYSEEFFKGHFPNNPIVPGVLLIESMAQSGLLLMTNLGEPKIEIGYLVSIKKCSFHKIVKPNEITFIKTKKTGEFNSFVTVKSIITDKKDKKIASSILTLSI